MEGFKLGILDFGYAEDCSGSDFINGLSSYASLADELGFSRLWLSEHHNCPGHGWSNPEILIPLLAAKTKKIRVGIAGILLAVHSPYRVALNFKLLETMFPGRIDLGLAKGVPEINVLKKMRTSFDPAKYASEFEKKMLELFYYFQDNTKLWEQEKLFIPPLNGNIPNIWKLTIADTRLQDCVKYKMQLSISMFHSNDIIPLNKEKLLDFRSEYMIAHNMYPQINIAVAGLCDRKRYLAVRSFNDLKSRYKNKVLVGEPGLFKEKFSQIKEESGINEFIFHDTATTYKKKMKTLEFLAKEFGF